jgi:hypothetical protein
MPDWCLIDYISKIILSAATGKLYKINRNEIVYCSVLKAAQSIIDFYKPSMALNSKFIYNNTKSVVE